MSPTTNSPESPPDGATVLPVQLGANGHSDRRQSAPSLAERLDGSLLSEDEEYEDEEYDDDARFLDVCIDGDVDDLVALLEEMAKAGEVLTPEILNYADPSGRVRQKVVIRNLYI